MTGRAPRRRAQLIVRMAEQTPPTRDRYVDFLRALAILAVVCGHWMIATIQRTPHGIAIGNVLSHQPGLRPLTWVFTAVGIVVVIPIVAALGAWVASAIAQRAHAFRGTLAFDAD